MPTRMRWVHETKIELNHLIGTKIELNHLIGAIGKILAMIMGD